MRKKLKWVGIGLAALVAFSFARDFVIKTVVTTAASHVLGAPVRMSGFSLGVMTQSVRIRGLKVHNPKGFPREPFVDIPWVRVDCDLPALLGGKLHLRKLEFELKELVVVRDAQGKMNTDALKVSQSEPRERGKEKKPAQQMEMQIDLMSVKIGRVVQKELSASGEPQVKVYEVGLEKTYKNITSPQQLALLILTEPMKQAGIRGAAIYGAAALTGVGLVPVVAGSILLGKDSAEAEFQSGYDRVYQATVDLLKASGTVKTADKERGLIKADLPAAGVTMKLERTGGAGVHVTVSARKLMLPKKEVAQGILYELSNRLK